jgi:hypothetical protein
MNSPNGNGNGNGSGNGKIFDLAPKEDPILAIVCPISRRKIAKDKSLPMGARVMYDFLIDYSLWREKCPVRGVVTMPNGDVARHLGISTRSVQNYKGLLRSRGAIFTSEKFLRNAWPATVYYITAIVGQEQLPGMEDFDEGRLADDDSVTRSNRRRLQPKFRDEKGKWLKQQQLDAIQLDAYKNLPAAHATGFVPGTQHGACLNGNVKPARHEMDSVPGTHEESESARLPVRATHAMADVPGTRPDADKGGATDVSIQSSGAALKRSTGFNARNAPGGAKKPNAEDAFLFEVADVMELWKPGSSKRELDNSGAMWRNSYRKNSDLALRTLADVRSLVKEGKIKFNPPSAFIDLWIRLGGGKVTNEALKQKAAARTAAR